MRSAGVFSAEVSDAGRPRFDTGLTLRGLRVGFAGASFAAFEIASSSFDFTANAAELRHSLPIGRGRGYYRTFMYSGGGSGTRKNDQVYYRNFSAGFVGGERDTRTHRMLCLYPLRRTRSY